MLFKRAPHRTLFPKEVDEFKKNPPTTPHTRNSSSVDKACVKTHTLAPPTPFPKEVDKLLKNPRPTLSFKNVDEFE